jgi:hypothetical protein
LESASYRLHSQRQEGALGQSIQTGPYHRLIWRYSPVSAPLSFLGKGIEGFLCINQAESGSGRRFLVRDGKIIGILERDRLRTARDSAASLPLGLHGSRWVVAAGE